MRLIDGRRIDPASPGGHLWRIIQEGGQLIALDTFRGQQVLDLAEVQLELGLEGKICGWMGSLSLATSLGMPDDYTLDIGDVRDALYNLQECLMRASRTLPILVDLDACYGNPLRAFAMLNVLQAAVGVTENKRPDCVKVNSLVCGENQRAHMADLEDMRRRLGQGKKVQQNTLVGARIENLILGYDPQEAADYMRGLQDLTDLILVHWNQEDPAPLFEAATEYRAKGRDHRPLIAVTTSYGANTTPAALQDAGFQILVYPNQVTRLGLNANRSVYQSLLTDGTAGGALSDQLPATREVIRRFAQPGTFTHDRVL